MSPFHAFALLLLLVYPTVASPMNRIQRSDMAIYNTLAIRLLKKRCQFL